MRPMSPKNFARMLLIAILLVILIPITFLAWRAGQPMKLPQFNRLTYYQVLEWEQLAHENLISKYEAAHPSVEYKGIGNRMTACFWGSFLPLSLTVGVEESLMNTVMSFGNGDRREAMLKAGYFAPDQPVTIWNFLPSWWGSYEKVVLDGLNHEPQTSVVYCRIQPDIPTPAELEAMKHAHQEVSGNP